MLKKIIICVVVVVLIVAGYRYWEKDAKNGADDVFVKINAVWAVQGPFKSGAESAQAMRYATKAAGGPDSFYDRINTHAAAYDAHRDRWEGIRMGCLKFAKGEKFETCLEAAKKLGAVVNPNYASSSAH